MSGSEMSLPTIDLNGPVSRDQYNTMASVLAPSMDAYGRRRGWCSERHDYFAGILPEYDSVVVARYHPAPSDDSTEDYAEKTRQVRSAILWHVNDGSVTLAEANEVLRAAGLPEGVAITTVQTKCAVCGRDHGSGSREVVAESEVRLPGYIG